MHDQTAQLLQVWVLGALTNPAGAGEIEDERALSPVPRVLVRELHVAQDGYPILTGLDLEVRAGEAVSILGPSGSGKTTLLHVLLGLIPPDRGEVRLAGQSLGELSDRELRAHRAHEVGVVFQFGELLPELSPVENVLLPAWFSGDRTGETADRAAALLRSVGIDPERGTAGTLSGGERQRVAVARALINRPSLLLADEPTGSLDSVSTATVADLLFELPRRHGTSLVVVTHDVDIAARADRVLVLEDGALRPAAPPG